MMKIENDTIREIREEIKQLLFDCTKNNHLHCGRCLIIKYNQLEELVNNILQIINIYEKETKELNEKISILDQSKFSNIEW